jgi:hypothetical protein
VLLFLGSSWTNPFYFWGQCANKYHGTIIYTESGVRTKYGTVQIQFSTVIRWKRNFGICCNCVGTLQYARTHLGRGLFLATYKKRQQENYQYNTTTALPVSVKKLRRVNNTSIHSCFVPYYRLDCK